ncbi:MAG: 50S ribosomal protein L21 [Myxococcota bacterium]
MYAVVEAGGKQHRVSEGDLVKVEKIEGEVGAEVRLERVLMIAVEGETKVGRPVVEGASVTAEIVRQGRDKKVIVFKKKPNKQYRRKKGHRQPFTHLRIKGISS